MPVLEVSVMPSAKTANRAEKMPLSDRGEVDPGSEPPENDFDAAYAADTDADTDPASKDTSEPDGDEPKGAAKDGSTVQVAEAETTPTPDAGPEEEILLADQKSSRREPIASEKAVGKAGAATSELAFIQRVMAENSPSGLDHPEAKTSLAQGQGEVVQNATTGPVQSPSGDMTARQQTFAPMAEIAAPARSPTSADAVKSAATLAATAPKPDIDGRSAAEDHASVRNEEEKRTRTPTEQFMAPKTKTASMAPGPAAPVASALQISQTMAQPDASSLDLTLSPVSDLDTPTSWDPRTASSTGLTQTLARPETPGMIGRQMAEILQRFPDRPVELSLNPEELGRVKLNITAAEGGITVHVLAERPETLDLMRRHIDQLAREFAALGYESINFAFNEGKSDTGTNADSEKESGPSHLSSEIEPGGEPVDPIILNPSSGVDLRL